MEFSSNNDIFSLRDGLMQSDAMQQIPALTMPAKQTENNISTMVV
ncbi:MULTISPECIES: hypothetical protein [unclassified Undibacterium]